MKLLHTGDWHVGRSLGRVSRLEETRAALSEMAGIAESEDVDVVLVCGDVFEHQSPSAEAEQVVYEALLRFGRDGRSVVLLAGNHDHPGRWRALAPLLQRFDIHVVDDLRRATDGGIIDIRSRDGKELMQIAAIPWVSERRLFEGRALMSGEKPYTSYAEGMGAAVKELCDHFSADACRILAGHLYISGTVPSGSERPLVVGDTYAVLPNAVRETNAQYIALGHVHRPHQVIETPLCRYAGSPIRLDFGEVKEQKSVTVVEVHPGLPVAAHEVPLRSLKLFLDLHCTLDELEGFREEAKDAYVRVKLKCGGPAPGLSDQVREIIPGALIISLDYPEKSLPDAVDVRSKTPRQLFEGYLSVRSEAEPDPELLGLFDSLLAEVSASPSGGRLWSDEAEGPNGTGREAANGESDSEVAELLPLPASSDNGDTVTIQPAMEALEVPGS
ncbi:MAG TPA: exonuclease SbcCD subunit D C-terminal domain-containing protein [Chloroflexota bacterium]|nr:exonuclease SbcCD subunit D C-terminal domain-containing protein [Chloroflexota bacterium]